MKTYAYIDAARSAILVTDGGEAMTVPTHPGNRHFREILDGLADGSITVSEHVAPEPVVMPDYDAELATAISAATTLDELKAALVGGMANARARVGGRPK